jgi:glutamate carboxypeptidase
MGTLNRDSQRGTFNVDSQSGQPNEKSIVSVPVDGRRLLTWCRHEERWLRELIESLVRLESPSTDTQAVERCGAELARRLDAIGARVDRLPGRGRADLVRATFADASQRSEDDRPLLILGHFDTVWPVGQLDRMPLREEGGRLFGPGVFDMKSGIAVSMLAIRALQAVPAAVPTVVMLWTTDEEIGSGASRAAIEHEARRSKAVLVMEPALPGGAAKTSRKGCGEFELVVHGIPAHAGIDPAKGASAILELAHQIVNIAELQDLDCGISVNVGVVSGGSRTNVVAAEARASIDVRVPTLADGERIAATLRSLQPRIRGTTLDVRGGIDRPPLERTEKGLRLYRLARDVAREFGGELGEGATGGGSDGNFTAALGVPTLDGLGPQGDGAHALHEHVMMEDLPWRAALVAGLINHLSAVAVE